MRADPCGDCHAIAHIGLQLHRRPDLQAPLSGRQLPEGLRSKTGPDMGLIEPADIQSCAVSRRVGFFSGSGSGMASAIARRMAARISS